MTAPTRRTTKIAAILALALSACGGSGRNSGGDGGTSGPINPLVSATLSTLSIEPSSVVADGTTAVTATATARDHQGNALSGVTVAFAATGSNNAWVPSSATTDSSGIASAKLTSSKAEQKTISATAGGVAIAQTGQVTFASAPQSSRKQICAAGGSLAQSGVTLSIPAGALATCQDITLTVGGTTPSGFTAYSEFVKIEPASATFSTPATLTIPFAGDSTKARLFWSPASGTGWERQSTAATGTNLVAPISHPGSGFVGDGIVYVDPPDRSCVRTRLIRGATNTPATVALFFTVDDCQGRPITGLKCDAYPGSCDFVLKENGSSLSSEASAVILPRSGLQAFMSLVIDMSSSTAASLPSVIAGAKTFVQKLQVGLGLPVQISIQLFAGEAGLTEWQTPTLDTAKLLSRLDQLSTFTPGDPSSTNLNGALIAALERQATYKSKFEARNFGGAFTAGYVVVFTDGSDTAHRKTADDVKTAEKASPDDVLGVALSTPDLDSGALKAIAPSGIFTATSGAVLPQEFEALAASRIAGQIERTYLLGYCSTARAGTNTVSVEVKGATPDAIASYGFPATNFTPGCSTSTIQHQCNGMQCGGFGCGACDDRVAACNVTTKQCVDYCVANNVCGGGSFTNPNGYGQICEDVPTWSECGTSCLDLTSNAANCGACGNACPTGGGVCVASACTCRSGLTDCGGVCRVTASDPSNCGACGNVCATGGSCSTGKCVCPTGFAACGGTCNYLGSSADCGSCGTACAPGEVCAANACLATCRNVDSPIAPRSPAGRGLFSAAIGDLNGDGKPDLAVTSRDDNAVDVFIANGDGTFKIKVGYGSGTSPAFVAIGDLNGDGKPDLAVANQGAGTVSILIANGDGTFKPKVDYTTGSRPYSLAIGDLNGDGKPDLAVANSDSNTVSVLVANGDGTFKAKVDYATGPQPLSLAIGDLNGDGKPDLAVANAGASSASVLIANSDGSFKAKVDYETGSAPYSVAIGDLDGDGKPDLAVANGGASTASVLVASGNGTLKAKVDYATGSGPRSVAIGDLNGDGKPDLAVANQGARTASILIANGDGSFKPKIDYTTGSVPYSIAIGDLNGDGKPDLASASGATVSVLVANSDGSFKTRGVDLDVTVWGDVRSVAIGDLNGDDKPDLAIANQGASAVNILIANGDGTFKATVDYATGSTPYSAAIGDLNGDGKPDLAVANQGASTVSILIANGDGTFKAKVDYATGPAPVSVAISDLNGDGKPDLAVADFGANAVSVLIANGDGTFKAKVDYATGPAPYSVAIGDLNGDGKPDLAVANQGASTVSVLIANGDGTFKAKVDYATGPAPVSVAIHDLNGDGKPDVAVANSGASAVSVLIANGDGTFKAKVDYATSHSAQSVAIGDLNGDGKPDLATANVGASYGLVAETVSVLIANGDGTFKAKVDYAPSYYARSVAIGDLNCDGKPDLAVANYGGTVSILLGECLP